MMKRNFRNWRVRLPAFFLAGFLCVLAVLAFFFLKSIGQILEENTRVGLLESSRQSAGSLGEKLQSDLTVLRSVGAALSQDALLTENESIGQLLENQYRENQFGGLWITLSDGTLLTGTGAVPALSLSDRNCFESSGIISDIQSLANKEQGIVYRIPLESSQGEALGTLFAARTLPQLEGFLTDRVFNNQCYAVVLHRDGRVLFYSDNYPGERDYENFFALMDRVHRNLYVNDILRSDVRTGVSDVQRFIHRFAEDRYMSYCPITGMDDWYVLTVVPVSVVSLPVRRVLVLTAAAAIVLICGIGGLSAYLLASKASNKRQLEHLAYIDSVTGLYNENRFEKEAEQHLRRWDKGGMALIAFDVENFKLINDLLGYSYGDSVLCAIALGLRETFGKEGLYARQNGDKFLVLLKSGDDAVLERQMETLFEQISCQCCGDDVHVNFTMTFACGICRLQREDQAVAVNTLIDRATIARKSVKQRSINAIAFYDNELLHQIVEEKTIENSMKTALSRGEFILHLQPQYDCGTEKIKSAEALVRWQHPERGLLQPGAFIPIFERNGSITQIDLFVFESVCKILRKWIDQGMRPLPISFNMSRLHLHNPGFPEELKNIREKYRIPGNLLVVELTESAFFDGKGRLLATMSQLKEDGFFISIDDFGTGYSSLNLLKDMTADEVKLDREFFAASAENQRGRTIIASIVGMARQLNMSTVAEGVETVEQVELLRDVGCNVIQGFYYARPMPVETFEVLYYHQLENCKSVNIGQAEV